ncbi:MAG: sigma-70 family RNA polymerase sigma factor [Haliscomenobacter sp.]|uniref:RNA polymerase sigma factor n=1 Tax=Haliscomenobacter sp. TaxID=2717303 RepID=UPI0029BD6265|nr:sigma-70 family RNA polymerase sigma factor [Haliscomenobacter sp.]MDX2070703.1 sigma-70 family RNA polymerase sigma factor [Haliscomenobacter sp.]
MEQQKLIPHLFRTEFRKITAVLTRFLGIEHLELAEDLVSETFVLALETWPHHGIPDNPSAWLYTVAKNKAKNQLKRQQLFQGKIRPDLMNESDLSQEPELDLSPKNITDSQLQMLFAICHPVISVESQIGLALRTLCGFGIDEIAIAFLSSKETINKRLFRAREKLRQEKVAIEIPGAMAIQERLASVLTTLYLLFSEGYYSESQDSVLRKDFCLEAMRLTYSLIEYAPTNQPQVNALMALMCFQASRFEARINEKGEMLLYHEQDESQWDEALIARGAYFLKQAAQGNALSKYHLEAQIAYWHTIKKDSPEKWQQILQLYNHLLVLEYSPIIALNRTYVLAKVKGNAVAILEAEKLKLENNHFYYTLLGELYLAIDPLKAKIHLERALAIAKTQTDKQIIQKKIDQLKA